MARATKETVETWANLKTAIVQTVAYVDGFDYPLTAEEVHRYLIGMPASLKTVNTLLTDALNNNQLHKHQNYYMLPNRQSIVSTRQERMAKSQQLWPQAIHYGRLLGKLPFVHMVAVTGSLAVNNAEEGADIDYLVVTENGRLWTSRAFIILLVKQAARHGIIVCPNYLLSQRALAVTDHSLYMAHEVVQTIPIVGLNIYRRFRLENQWTDHYLPNAKGAPTLTNVPTLGTYKRTWQAVVEAGLRSPVGNLLETWEMNRKIRKFSQSLAPDAYETAFSPDWCKGHFDNHGRQAMHNFETNLKKLTL